jgi:ankyrin repeat protein
LITDYVASILHATVFLTFRKSMSLQWGSINVKNCLEPLPNYLNEDIRFHLTAHFGIDTILKVMIGRSRDCGTKINSTALNQNPLEIAVIEGHESVVRLLLGRDDVTCHDVQTDLAGLCIRKIPLLVAAAFTGNVAAVRLLMEQGGIDINQGPDTTLIFAIYGIKIYKDSTDPKDFGVLCFLEEKGADTNLADLRGNTPLHMAARSPYCGKMAPLLLEKGASIDSKNGDGLTPLSIAIGFSNELAVSILLRNGADVHTRDIDGRTPLSHAVQKGSVRVILKLLEAGADIHSVDNKGRTLASWVVDTSYYNDDYEGDTALRLLVEKGADINARDNEGRTPLARMQSKIEHEKNTDMQRAWPEYYTSLLRLEQTFFELGGTPEI